MFLISVQVRAGSAHLEIAGACRDQIGAYLAQDFERPTLEYIGSERSFVVYLPCRLRMPCVRIIVVTFEHYLPVEGSMTICDLTPRAEGARVVRRCHQIKTQALAHTIAEQMRKVDGTPLKALEAAITNTSLLTTRFHDWCMLHHEKSHVARLRLDAAHPCVGKETLL